MTFPNLIKTTLATLLLLLLCLLKLPYGYYQLVRFMALIGFGFLAYQAHQKENLTNAFIYVALAILFQPFFKIALGREICGYFGVMVPPVSVKPCHSSTSRTALL